MKYKYLLLIIPVGLLCLQACKTDPVVLPKVTLLGRWYTVKHNLKLIRDGVQVGETIRTTYTKDDFSQFLEDGTGYQSSGGAAILAGFSKFHYTLKGNVITFYGDANKSIEETITTLTETELVIHYESQIAAPDGSGGNNLEIDDFAFKR